jgi:hypothetical protein
VKVSQLCKMIEDSIHGGRYPLQNEHKPFSNLLQVINRSDSDDLNSRIPGFKIVYGGLIDDTFTTFKIGEDITMYLNLELRTNSRMA